MSARRVIVTFRTVLNQALVYEADEDTSDEQAASRALDGVRDGDLRPTTLDMHIEPDSVVGWTAGRPCPIERRSGYNWCVKHDRSPADGEPRCWEAIEVERGMGVA